MLAASRDRNVDATALDMGKKPEMNERRGTFEDDLTEETLPDPAKREDVAENLHGDPDVNSQADDRAMGDDRFGENEPDKPTV